MFVDDREDMYGIDAAILMNPEAWVASGHVGGFSDPLVECSNCKKRFRVDQIVDEKDYKKYVESFKSYVMHAAHSGEHHKSAHGIITKLFPSPTETEKEYIKKTGPDIEYKLTKMTLDEVNKTAAYVGEVAQIYLNLKNTCSSCNKKQWGTPKQFNMMFSTSVGATEDAGNVTYLRPETAGGMFVNYKNVVDSFHPKLPFGLGQIGKAFRNEIAPRDFIFRVRELEQMEVEYFVHPDTWKEHFELWRKEMWRFIEAIGISKEHVHELEVEEADRAHYSKRTIDFEYDYPFGRKELYGLAYRTDFDLKSHQEGSKVNLEYFDEETKEKFLPHVIEPSLGVGRTMLAILNEAYTEDELGGEKRVYLKFKSDIAPIRVAVFPLLKNKPELVAKAREVFVGLKKELGNVLFDDNGNIGKRYRRQDEIGTPWCVTIDFDTLGETPSLKDTVTLRNRDTGAQERVTLSDLLKKLR
jgi:glycyl-tRNA synthetase